MVGLKRPGKWIAMTETNPAKIRLQNALDAALKRYELMMGYPYSVRPALDVVVSDQFVALARPIGNDNGFEITVTTGVLDRLSDLWERAISLSDGLPEASQLNVGDIDQAVDASLVFLMLHELHHHYIGHLELVGSAGLSETGFENGMGLTRVAEVKPPVLSELDPDEAIAVWRCLELQADHDAIEIHLEHYSKDAWPYIRFYMATAMAVMILIEKQGDTDDSDRTYPLSATRIFQVFGALALLWQPIETSDWDAPEDHEIEAYHGAVVAPAISDAIILAAAGGVEAIANEHTDADDLFEDMRMLQEPHKHDLTQLKTTGAREYASLFPANEKAKELLGLEKFAT